MAVPISSILVEDELEEEEEEEERRKKEEETLKPAPVSEVTVTWEPSDDVVEVKRDNLEKAALSHEREVVFAEYELPGKDEEESEDGAAFKATSQSSCLPAMSNATFAPPTVAKDRIRLPHIPSIANFRALLWDRERNPVIFRSARHEGIAYEDLKAFMSFDIKTIIDLRSCQEYSLAKGDCLLDRIYPVFDVSLPKDGNQFSAKDAKMTQVSYNFPEEETALVRQFVKPDDGETKRRRLLIPICNKQYIIKLMKEVGGYHVTFVRAIADLATFFKYGFLTRHFVNYYNREGQWRLYVSYLECGHNAIVAALKVINEPDNLPVIINCHVGKDRTGVLSAILLVLVGVARKDVLRDFSRSEQGIQHVRDEIREYMTSQHMFWDEEFLHAFPDDLARTFDFIEDKYGSINNYLHVYGFTYDEQARLKENLLAGSRASIEIRESRFDGNKNENPMENWRDSYSPTHDGSQDTTAKELQWTNIKV